MRIAVVVLAIVAVVVLVLALRAIFRASIEPEWKANAHTIEGRYVILLEKPGEESVVIDAIPVHDGNYEQRKAKAETRAYEMRADWNATDRGLSQ